MLIPTIIDKTPTGERAYDIYSRLLKNRIIMLGDVIDSDVANSVVAQLLYLDSDNNEKEIKIYINSPGGSVVAGFAIYDTMRIIKSPVSTICIGHAASMGAFLLAGGDKGKRFALPNAEIMIHQVMGGTEGQATDIQIHAENILKTKARLNKIFAENTGQSIKKITADTERDYYMDSDEALEYGLIDGIIK